MRLFLKIPIFITACFVLAHAAMAQSLDKVKSDVLSALSTPLPITIVGPMLARDVEVTEEGESFRATLKGASLMGFFPIGDVSMTLTPLDAETYRITDMAFPLMLDFPGMATISHSSMALEGTWSATSRSYSDLNWVINDLSMTPANLPDGTLTLGALSFDVAKAPEGGGTESRFVIGARDIAMQGLTPDNVSLGRVEARLLANGEEPVDLYSVIREIAVRSTMRDGGAGLQALAASLLGNTYETVSLELEAGQLDISRVSPDNERFLRAQTLGVSASLNGVAPRNWDAADISLKLGNLVQKDTAMDGEYSVEEALVSLRASELPVAAMFNVYKLLEGSAQGRPVLADELLDGLASFGKIEVVTRGTALETEALKRVYNTKSTQGYELKPHFDVAYDSWNFELGLADLNRNAGHIFLTAGLSGGAFVPRDAFDDDALPEIEAWFPKTLKLSTRIGSLNEAFLKKVLKGVSIHSLNEPVELVLPMILYASATVFDVSSGEDVYETGLFRMQQSGQFKFYPTEVLNLLPYEGAATVRLDGLDNLIAYIEALPERGAMKPSEMSAARSALVVARNLARDVGGGALEWDIARTNVKDTEVKLNEETFRYPSVAAILPTLLTFVVGQRF